MVWDLIRHSHHQTLNGDLDDAILFKLFCLYNRFCDPLDPDLKIRCQNCDHLLRKMDIFTRLANENQSFTFPQFLIIVKNFVNSEKVKVIDRLYQKWVQSILCKDNLCFRLYHEANSWSAWSGLSGFPFPGSTPHFMTVTHRDIIIYRPEISCQDQDPKAILHQISLSNAIAESKKDRTFLFTRKDVQRIHIRARGPDGSNLILELIFNDWKDQYKIFRWTEAINQAAIFNKDCSDPLSIEYRIHQLRPSFFQCEEADSQSSL